MMHCHALGGEGGEGEGEGRKEGEGGRENGMDMDAYITKYKAIASTIAQITA